MLQIRVLLFFVFIRRHIYCKVVYINLGASRKKSKQQQQQQQKRKNILLSVFSSTNHHHQHRHISIQMNSLRFNRYGFYRSKFLALFSYGWRYRNKISVELAMVTRWMHQIENKTFEIEFRGARYLHAHCYFKFQLHNGLKTHSLK